MVSATYDWPTDEEFTPEAFVPGVVVRNQRSAESPYTGSVSFGEIPFAYRNKLTVMWPAQRWAERAKVIGWLHKVRAPNLVRIPMLTHPAPTGTMRGAPTAGALSQGAMAVTLTQSSGSQGGSLKMGDRIGITTAKGIQVVTVTADTLTQAHNRQAYSAGPLTGNWSLTSTGQTDLGAGTAIAGVATARFSCTNSQAGYFRTIGTVPAGQKFITAYYVNRVSGNRNLRLGTGNGGNTTGYFNPGTGQFYGTMPNSGRYGVTAVSGGWLVWIENTGDGASINQWIYTYEGSDTTTVDFAAWATYGTELRDYLATSGSQTGNPALLENVPFEPPLRASVAGGAAVTWDKPTSTYVLRGDWEANYRGGSNAEPLAVEFIEVW